MDLQFDVTCMVLYESIIRHLLQRNEAKTTWNDDKLLLSNDTELSGNMRMAVVYRSERKKILYSQSALAKFVISILKSSIELMAQRKAGKEP